MNKERRDEREAKAIVDKTLEIEPVEGGQFCVFLQVKAISTTHFRLIVCGRQCSI